MSELLTGNAFSVLYKCKEKNKQTKTQQKMSLEELERAVCAPYVALPPLLELYAVQNMQSAEVQGTTLTLKTL